MALQDNSNLLKQVNASRLTRFPKGSAFYKILGLDILVILAAFSSSWLYLGYLDGRFNSLLPILAVALLMIFSVFEVLMAKNFSRRAVVLILEIAAFIVPFYIQNKELNYYYFLAAGAVMFFFLFWGELKSRKTLRNSLSVSFFRISKIELSKLTTALVLVFLVFLFPQINSQKSAALSEYFFGGIYSVSVKIANSLYPEINLKGNYGDFVSSFVNYQLSQDIHFETMPPSVQSQLRDAANVQIASQLNNVLGAKPSLSEPLSNVFQDYLARVIGGWQIKYGIVFFTVWLALFFFFVRGIAVLFYWAVALVSWFIYEILITSDFLRLAPRNRVQEVVEI